MEKKFQRTAEGDHGGKLREWPVVWLSGVRPVLSMCKAPSSIPGPGHGCDSDLYDLRQNTK